MGPSGVAYSNNRARPALSLDPAHRLTNKIDGTAMPVAALSIYSPGSRGLRQWPGACRYATGGACGCGTIGARRPSADSELAWLCLKRPPYALGIAGDHGEIGARRLVGLGAPLPPIAQGAKRDVIARREFFLRQPERPAQCPGARNSFRLRQLIRREGRRVGITPRR